MSRYSIAILLMLFFGLPVIMAQATDEEKQLIRARFLVSGQQYEQALAILRSGPPSAILESRWVLTEAVALSAAGQFDQARSLFEKLRRQFPAESNYHLALISIRLGDKESAVKYLADHLASRQHYSEKFIKLEPAFRDLEDSREWVDLWQNEWYSRKEKDLAEVRYLISSGQSDDAIRILQNIAAGDDRSAEVHYLEGVTMRLAGKEKQGLQILEESLREMKDNETLLAESLDYFTVQNLDHLASQALGYLQSLDPTNPEYFLARSLILAKSTSGAATLNEIRKLQDLGINDPYVNYAAAIRIKNQFPDQAVALLTEAIDSGILDARFYFTRGVIRCNHSDLEHGLNDLAMSLDINPNQPELYLERGSIRRAAGDEEGACRDWNKALRLGSSQAADLLYKYCR